MSMMSVLERVAKERERQDAKWGEQNHAPLKWSVILTEECGEVAKAALEVDHAAYISELVQVAAVAVAAVESALRGKQGRCGKVGCPCCAQLCDDTVPEVQP